MSSADEFPFGRPGDPPPPPDPIWNDPAVYNPEKGREIAVYANDAGLLVIHERRWGHDADGNPVPPDANDPYGHLCLDRIITLSAEEAYRLHLSLKALASLSFDPETP